MAFQDLNPQLKFRKLKLWDKGDRIIGKFINIREGGIFKGNMTYQIVIEALEVPNFVDYKDNEIAVGDKLAIPSNKILMDTFEPLDKGAVVSIEYTGKVPTKDGNNTYHTFKIMEDDGAADETDDDL